MKLFDKYLTVASFACFSVAFAGRIEVNFNAPVVDTTSMYTANLLQVESAMFSKNADALGDSLLFKIVGDKPLDDSRGNPLPLNIVRTIKFNSSNGEETMKVNVKAGDLKGEHAFRLQDIVKIDFVEEDKTTDTDGDGLPDYMEVYVHGTDPTSKDTDGDGWDDNVEIGRYDSSNPTKWNPKVSDLPNLLVEMTKTPEIYLNISKSQTESRTETITNGESTSDKVASTKSETHSSALMHAWNFSLANTFAVSAGERYTGAKWTLGVTVGYNGSYTMTDGYTMSSTEESSITRSYSDALSTAKTNGETVTGAKVCVDTKLSNTGSIAYTVENLASNLSAYFATEGMKIVTTLTPEVSGQFTLQPGATNAVDRKFCNANVPLEQLGKLIYNPGAMFVDASSYKITMNREGKTTDFTEDYTGAFAKTATVVVDYGPNFASKSVSEHMVAVKYRLKMSDIPTSDTYERVSVADLLKTLGLSYVEDEIVNSRNESVHALKTLNGVSYGVGQGQDTSMWFVAISRAVTPNVADLYSAQVAGFSLDTLMVNAGDRVQFIYNEDHDRDGIPASMEKLLGINDNNVDSDGDQLSDYGEINGWARLDGNGDTLAVFRTNPAQPDTDGDDEGDHSLWDKDDPNPNERARYTNPYIDSIVVRNDLTQEEYVARGKCAIAGYMCAYTVFDLDSVIYTGDITANIVTERPVSSINLAVNGYPYVQAVKEHPDYNDHRHYTFTLNKNLAQLQVSRKNVISLTVTPEDGDPVESKLYINSSLKKPLNLSLGRDHDRGSIILTWSPYSDDSRILGYVVLRAEGSKKDSVVSHNEILASMNNTVERVVPSDPAGTWSLNFTDVVSDSGPTMYRSDRQPVDGFVLGGGVSMRKVLNSDVGTFSDDVGGGSPYYSYRVYAYTKEGDYYYFSPASEIKTRAVGRIKFEYQLVGHGTEYLYAWGFRLDATIRAWFYNGSGTNFPLMHYYDYWFCDAGRVGKGNTVVYEDKSDKRGNGDKNDVSMDQTLYTAEIGSQGVMLKLSTVYDGGWYESPTSQHQIKWPYAKMASVLNGNSSPNSKDGDAPKVNWEVNKFNWGQSGIEYNTLETDDGNGCDEDCGDEPHAGFKFKTRYSWADPD